MASIREAVLESGAGRFESPQEYKKRKGMWATPERGTDGGSARSLRASALRFNKVPGGFRTPMYEDVSPDQAKAIIKYIASHPEPSDKEFHNFAVENGIDPETAEEFVYKIAHKLVKAGSMEEDEEEEDVDPIVRASDLKHADVPDRKFDARELKRGIEVEKKEHHDNPTISKAIAKAHLMELPDYYTRLDKMEKEGEEYWEKHK